MSRKLTLNEIENSLDNNAMYVFEYDEQHNIEYETLCLYCSTEEGEVFFTDRCGNLYAYSKETYGEKWDCEASNACVYDDEPMTTAKLVDSIKYEFDNAMPDDDTKLDFEGIINICKRLGTRMDTQINVSQAIDAARIVLADYENLQRGIIPHW